MIYFKKLRWKNLLSTGNVFTEIDLANNPTTLIVGINGAGKSTILDALSFGLFGKPFRKINKPQLLNTITQKNLVVEIEFSIGTIEYKIIRGIKPNVFEVHQNGKLLNQSAESKDYQEILEKQIIKVNHKSFSQVVVLGSATFQPFMQLSAQQKREIIEDLLDLQIFTTMNSLLKDKNSENDSKITKNNTERKVIESKIELTEQHMFEMQNNTGEIIAEKKKQISKLEDEGLAIYNELKDYEDKIAKMEGDLEDIQSINERINKLSKLKHRIEARVNVINEEVKFFTENTTCPTCKQDIAEEFRDKTVNIKKQEISDNEAGLETLAEQYDKEKQQLSVSMNKAADVHSLKLERIRCMESVKAIKNNIIQLNKDVEKLKEVKSIEKDERLNGFKQDLEKIAEDYNLLIEEKNVLSSAAVLLKDNGIKAKIIKQYIPIINKLINKYLSAMDFFVSFELDENFKESIKSRHRDDFSYDSFSEGEKQKIDLALLFTWRAIAKMRNSINTNLLIMDEVFDSSLDLNSTEYLINIIRDIAKDNNIVIISHKEHMNEKFTNVIKFVKIKNFSQIQR
jgi:DNA repair exonuclease SbcCD ATPase subunit